MLFIHLPFVISPKVELLFNDAKRFFFLFPSGAVSAFVRAVFTLYALLKKGLQFDIFLIHHLYEPHFTSLYGLFVRYSSVSLSWY